MVSGRQLASCGWVRPGGALFCRAKPCGLCGVLLVVAAGIGHVGEPALMRARLHRRFKAVKRLAHDAQYRNWYAQSHARSEEVCKVYRRGFLIIRFASCMWFYANI